MRRNGVPVVAPLATLAIVLVLAFGIGTVRASNGTEASPQFGEGTVLHATFSVGRGIRSDGQLEEAMFEYWLRVGPAGQEDVRRAVLKASDGRLLQEGIRSQELGRGTTYIAETDEVVQAPRPSPLSAVMWTEDLVSRELLDQGFRLVTESLVAGVPARVYEQKADLGGEPPAELLTAAGIRSDDVTGIVRRLYVGSEPFGVDLGEEAGYLLRDGSEFIPYFRRMTTWDVSTDAPVGAFDWSADAARRISR